MIFRSTTGLTLPPFQIICRHKSLSPHKWNSLFPSTKLFLSTSVKFVQGSKLSALKWRKIFNQTDSGRSRGPGLSMDQNSFLLLKLPVLDNLLLTLSLFLKIFSFLLTEENWKSKFKINIFGEIIIKSRNLLAQCYCCSYPFPPHILILEKIPWEKQKQLKKSEKKLSTSQHILQSW